MDINIFTIFFLDKGAKSFYCRKHPIFQTVMAFRLTEKQKRVCEKCRPPLVKSACLEERRGVGRSKTKGKPKGRNGRTADHYSDCVNYQRLLKVTEMRR
jgi:hypothetical protein